MEAFDERLRILKVCSARNLRYGAMRSMVTLSDGLKGAGHEVSFLTFKGRGGGMQLKERGEQVYEATMRVKVDPLGIGTMMKHMRVYRPDIVHAHLSSSSLNGCLAARFMKIPAVATVHGLSGKLSFQFADQLIAVSEEVKRHLIGQGVKPDRITVVYNAVDAIKVLPEEKSRIYRKLMLEEAFPILGTVARVTATKGIQDAIQAVALVKNSFPNVRYVVVGAGDYLEECQVLTAQLGLEDNVIFAGFQERPELYTANFDLFLFPSHKEAMGMAIVEASLLGIPTVACNVGGIPEVVAPEGGILVGKKDISQFARAICQLAEDKSRRERYGIEAKSFCESKFSLETMVTQTVLTYHRLRAKESYGHQINLPASELPMR